MNEFKSAVDNALSASKDFQGAKDDVKELLEGYAAAVQETMPHIDIRLSRFGEVGKVEAIATVLGSLGSLTRPKRRFGDDAEDRDSRLLVVATNGTAQKILWEVLLDKGAGYPMTIAGPVGDVTNLCFTKDDLRTILIKAAGEGVVGRKLRSLAPNQDTTEPREDVVSKTD